MEPGHCARPSIMDIVCRPGLRRARNMVSVALATAAAGIIVGVVALGLGGADHGNH